MNSEKEKRGRKKRQNAKKIQMTKKGKKLYLCFVDYTKAFDRVKHNKLAEVMEKTEVPELEWRLIINLYWRQHASVRWDEQVSRDVRVEETKELGKVA